MSLLLPLLLLLLLGSLLFLRLLLISYFFMLLLPLSFMFLYHMLLFSALPPWRLLLPSCSLDSIQRQTGVSVPRAMRTIHPQEAVPETPDEVQG